MIAVLTVFSSCGKDTLSVTPKELEFNADGGAEQFVAVKTNAAAWITTNIAGWISIKETDDGFYVSASSYTGTRSSFIIVSAGNADPETIIVTQQPAKPVGGDDDEPEPVPDEKILTVAPSQLEFQNGAESKPFTITANLTWEIASDSDWCTPSTEAGEGSATVNVAVTANSGAGNRTAQLTVANAQNAIVRNIAVTQAGKSTSIVIKPSTVDLGPFMTEGVVLEEINGEEFQMFEIEITLSPEVEDVEILISNTNWIFMEYGRKLNETTDLAYILISENLLGARSGTVTVRQNDGKGAAVATLTVFQRSGAICNTYKTNYKNALKSWEAAYKKYQDLLGNYNSWKPETGKARPAWSAVTAALTTANMWKAQVERFWNMGVEYGCNTSEW